MFHSALERNYNEKMETLSDPVAILWSKQRTMILQQAVEKLMLPSFEAELIQEMRTKYVTSATHTLLLRLQCTSSVLEAYSLVQL
eukprot:9367-Heterococcus_DN1.PRE.7